MRQRVLIAIAIACEPALLIADEPTTSLDATIQAQILALLSELKRSRGMSMVLITHDMGAVAGVADRVAVMRQGGLVEVDTVQEIFKRPRHEYTRVLLGSVPRVDDSRAWGAPNAAVAPGTPAVARSNPTLALDDVRVEFPVRDGWFGRHRTLRALQGVSLELAPGEAVGVVGESGSGKTTLARAALQLLRVASGRIVWLGRAVGGLSAGQL